MRNKRFAAVASAFALTIAIAPSFLGGGTANAVTGTTTATTTDPATLFTTTHQTTWQPLTLAKGSYGQSDLPTVTTTGTTTTAAEFPEDTHFSINTASGNPKTLITRGWKLSIDQETGVITAQAPTTAATGSYTIPVAVYYDEGTTTDVDTATVTLTVPATATTVQTYQPMYQATSVEQGESATVTPADPAHTTLPTGTKFAKKTGAPSWVTVNADTGALTVAPQESDAVDTYAVPLAVSYPGTPATTETLYASVTVTEPEPFTADHSATWAPLKMTAGGAAVTSSEPTVTSTDATAASEEFPEDTHFALNTNVGNPKTLVGLGWKLSINQETGAITAQAPANANAGDYNIPVAVYYEAGTTDDSDTATVTLTVAAATAAPTQATSAPASPSTSASTPASAAPTATATAPATVTPSSTATSAAPSPSATASAPATVQPSASATSAAPSASASAPATVAPSATASASASASTAPQASTTAKASETAKASTSAKASDTAKAEDKQVKKLPKTGVIGEAPVAAGLFGVALIGVAVTAVVRRRKG